MKVREVLKYPDPFLRETCESVVEVTSDIRDLMEDMVETMRVERGVGLAAPQVGVGKRVVVLNIPEEPEERDDAEQGEGERKFNWTLYKLINPEIVYSDGEVKFEEGCLSLPGINADVKRFAEVVVRALDENGRPLELKADGFFAIALQHEIDHLDGVLFIDRVSRLKRELLLRRYRKLMAAETAV